MKINEVSQPSTQRVITMLTEDTNNMFNSTDIEMIAEARNSEFTEVENIDEVLTALLEGKNPWL